MFYSPIIKFYSDTHRWTPRWGYIYWWVALTSSRTRSKRHLLCKRINLKRQYNMSFANFEKHERRSQPAVTKELKVNFGCQVNQYTLFPFPLIDLGNEKLVTRWIGKRPDGLDREITWFRFHFMCRWHVRMLNSISFYSSFSPKSGKEKHKTIKKSVAERHFFRKSYWFKGKIRNVVAERFSPWCRNFRVPATSWQLLCIFSFHMFLWISKSYVSRFVI